MKFLESISPLILLIVYKGAALDFDTAFENGRFEEIGGSASFDLDPETDPSKSMYFDGLRNKSSLHSLESIDLNFTISNLIDDPDFMTGISLVFLKFISSKSTKVTVETSVDYEEINRYYLEEGSFDIPKTNIPEEHIVKSWEITKKEDFSFLNMKVKLKAINHGQIYFTVTTYKIRRELSHIAECQGFSFNRKWWDCNTNEADSNLLCLNYALTCDGLPHCAKTSIPNPDENCGYHVGLQEALQLLVYSLLTIFIVLFVAGCAKCCLRGVCLSRRMGRRPSDILEILTAESSQRPDDSPPTYDDSMKYVNDAFEESDSETDQEAPPAYSPMPKEGEEVCARSPMSEEGAVGGSDELSQTPPGCSCQRSSIVRRRPRSKSPRNTESSEPNLPFPAVFQPLGARLPSTNSAGPAYTFNDNFVNTQHENLPKDPPPYTDTTGRHSPE